MAWVQFPFPECPGCHTSWAVSRHRDCVRQGSMEVQPDSRNVRCDACSQRWTVAATNFYCTCGRQFSASEVNNAVEQIIQSARLLATLIDRHQDEIARIRRQGRESFQSWLNTLAQTIGGGLGGLMGHIVGSVVRMLT